jgi:organic radical activating enzyme
MFGKNPKRAPEQGDGSMLQVVEIFPTLQGEGPFVGTPSVFVRLGGCNLACEFCDTEFENFHAMDIQVIAETIDKASMEGGKRVRHLVVITGGEPLRQPIAPLCYALLARDFKVQIETNGTLWRDLPPEVSIVCSPKAVNGSYGKLRADLLKRVDALKFLIAADTYGYQDIADVGQGKNRIPVYVQPMDQYDPLKNMANMARAIKLAQENGYHLSLQTHKLLGIP